MTRGLVRGLLALAVGACGLGLADDLHAQGVTTAAVSGRITNQEGNPLPGIEITVTNEATGVARTTVSNAQGTYLIPGLQVGGPYRVAASGLGYAEQTRTDFTLKLGENLVVTFELAVQAVQLGGLQATAAREAAIINPNRTGAEQLVTSRQLETMPSITRNFTDAIALSPLTGAGGGASSVGQQNNRFNNIQIDGAITQDLFGLGATGQPGGQAGARSITIEAVREYQILAAPYDVRQSGFTGGLINAVTKTGTNEFHGNIYGYFRDNGDPFIRQQLIVQGDTLGANTFENRMFGGTIGGPIIRDRLHFFLAGELEDDTQPGGDVAIGREAVSVTGIAESDADRFSDLLTARDVEPGLIGTREKKNPNRNLFARIDAQLGNAHSLTLRHNYVRAEDDIVTNRFLPVARYSFDSNWYFFENTTNSTVAQLNSTFDNGMYNEFTLGLTSIRDRRSPFVTYPEIRVTVPNAAGSGTKELRAGAEEFSQGNELDQDSWELTNNLSFTVGQHRITVGGHWERFKFRNLFQPSKTGVWTFATLDDFEAGQANTFVRNVPALAEIDPNARFAVSQIAAYAQTEWNVVQDVMITAGVRYDVPVNHDEPFYNPAIESSLLDRRTDQLPDGNGIFSPRLGFNWDVGGTGETQVRGGAGIFAGRFPFVWLSNVFGNTGVSTVQISCRASAGNMPAFTLDPANQPSTCAASGTPSPPRSVINLIDADFKYPHAWRLNIGVDRQLPWGIVGTADFVYSRSIAQMFLRELNVDFSDPVSTTQGGRPVFGTHTPGPITGANTNAAQPNRIDPDAATAVVELTNSDQDRSWSFTLQGQKRYTAGIDLNASYTYARAQDVSGLTSSIATSNIGFNPVKGSPNDPELATSDYEQRHKIVMGGSWDAQSWLTWSIFYVGNSGEGYSYVYDGDVNADGFEGAYANNRFNDLIYVPESQADISLVDPAAWADLNAYIEGEECLRESRGTIISRNECKEPWRHRVDTRLAFKVPTISGQRAELIVDVFNFLNLVNSDWGLSRGVPNPTIDLLEMRGWDEANNRGYFQPTGRMRLRDGEPNQLTTFDPASRWQAQIGIRYSF